MISPRRLLPVPLLVLALAASGCGDETTAKDVEEGAKSEQTAGAPETTPTVSATTSTEAADPEATAAAVKTLVGGISTDIDAQPKIASPTAPPPSELISEDVVEGKGTAAKLGDTVDVRYTLVNWGGENDPVDTSYGKAPGDKVDFPLEEGGLIEGWIKGVPGMKPGGRRVLVVPAAQGYGDAGTPDGAVPPGGTLIFVIDLVKAT